VGGHDITPAWGAITEGHCAEWNFEVVDISRVTPATNAPYEFVNSVHVGAKARDGAL
jgi:hypothetical protein